MKICINCGKELVGKQEKYCSKRCRWRIESIKYKKKISKRRKEYYKRNREKILERQKIWQKKRGNKLWSEKYKNNEEYRNKKKCRDKTRRVINLKKEKCSVCGSTEDLHRHHPDYNKPEDYIIFCRKHHNKKHFPEQVAKKLVRNGI